MTTGTKATIFISVLCAIAIGGVIWWKHSSKKDEGNDDDLKLPPEEENKGGGGNTGGGGGGATYPATPFKNANEGNRFRAWLNQEYPAKAKEFDLDPSGDYNNSFIRKAWAAYGQVYTNWMNAPTAGGGKKVMMVYPKPGISEVNVRDTPKVDDSFLGIGGNLLGSVKQGQIIGEFLRSTAGTDGKTWYHVQISDTKIAKESSASGRGYVRSDNVVQKQHTL